MNREIVVAEDEHVGDALAAAAVVALWRRRRTRMEKGTSLPSTSFSSSQDSENMSSAFFYLPLLLLLLLLLLHTFALHVLVYIFSFRSLSTCEHQKVISTTVTQHDSLPLLHCQSVLFFLLLQTEGPDNGRNYQPPTTTTYHLPFFCLLTIAKYWYSKYTYVVSKVQPFPTTFLQELSKAVVGGAAATATATATAF